MFQQLGKLIARHPLALVLAWSLVVALTALWAFSVPAAPVGNIDSFLPEGSNYTQAIALLRRSFPNLASRSSAVIVIQRDGGLKASDIRWLDQTAFKAAQRIDARYLSPALPFLEPRLISDDDGQAAGMALVMLPSNFISPKTAAAVDAIEPIVHENPPAGLTVEMTGTAVIGRDFFVHTERALDRTTWVTILAVLTILIFVYRSPVGAVVPLVAIGASVFLAFAVLAALVKAGWRISDVERIFAVVLLFGAGIDYALFWISRYREGLTDGLGIDESAIQASAKAGPAIFVGAATTICGLTTLLAARLLPTQSAGKILALVLTISLLAALTLSPALARLLGRRLFWPVGLWHRKSFGQRKIWPAIASIVTARPRLCLCAGLIPLGLLALVAVKLPMRFDSLAEVPPGSPSKKGWELAQAHFAKGQLCSNNVLLRFETPIDDLERAREISAALSRQVVDLPGVYDVYSLDRPMGRQTSDIGVVSSMTTRLASNLFLSDSGKVVRTEVLVDHELFSPEAMSLMSTVRQRVQKVADELADQGRQAEVFMSGPTAYVLAIEDVAVGDQRLVMPLATIVIGIVVFAMIRDWKLATFMLLATWLTYGATLTLGSLFFIEVRGLVGLDWKVRLIAFVIIMAVGQDYNIFLVTRLFQERTHASDTQATKSAIISTGAVISSCGLIMAATLGSLWAGRLSLLQQVGFTLALGILIDTFFVRPILIPSFFLAFCRRDKGVPIGDEAGANEAERVAAHE